MGIIAITMGDPAGIGPEIVIRAWQQARMTKKKRWLWIGDPAVLHWTARHLGLELATAEVSNPESAWSLAPEQLAVLPLAQPVDHGELRFGEPNPGHAAATLASIATACQLAMTGQVQALVTPPINKAVLHAAGYLMPGHTEFLADCTGAAHPVMLLVGRGLRVVPATIHTALRRVPELLTRELLQQVITITHQAMERDFGLAHPRLAITGLNPHAGENGAFGDEELLWLAPLCREMAATTGWSLQGPLPADSLFAPAQRRGFDVAICMYHDQALIPLKMLAFGQAVNVTLGLPVVRTSVDHGTAYPIAGQGRADPRSLIAAIQMAGLIAANRRKWGRS